MRSQLHPSQDKSPADLAREAVWFLTHTLIAFLLLVGAIGVMSLNHPDPDSITPKLLATILALIVPLVGGSIVVRFCRDNSASYVWISGLVIFSLACVWVLDLPTGNGLCESCTAGEKLWRTFFSFTHGSGLMAGDGVLIGSWIPLSMIGYATGSRIFAA